MCIPTGTATHPYKLNKPWVIINHHWETAKRITVVGGTKKNYKSHKKEQIATTSDAPLNPQLPRKNSFLLWYTGK